jgi:hypothetical protein
MVSAALAGKLVGIYDFPDGRPEIRSEGQRRLRALDKSLESSRRNACPPSRASIGHVSWCFNE